MKTIELWNQVTRLMYDQINSKEAFYIAANRAYSRVNQYAPLKGRVVLHHNPVRPVMRVRNIGHCSSEEQTYKLPQGYAYSFRATGMGKATIVAKGVDGLDVKQTIEWSPKDSGNGYARMSGFLLPLPAAGAAPIRASSATITFEGAYRYFVEELQVFDDVVSNRTVDILEYGDDIAYDFSLLFDDFSMFSETPVKKECCGEYGIARRYLIRGNVLHLLSSDNGNYLVEYRKKLAKIEEDTDFELDDDIAQVIAYPVAAELLLEVDREMAAYYEDMFIRQISTIIAKRERMENPIFVTNGWEN